MNKDVLFSQKKDDWATPDHIKKYLYERYNLISDPFPLHHDLKKWDAMDKKYRWGKRCFINPPYSKIKKVLQRGALEKKYAECQVYLLPARVCTKWFHELLGGFYVYFIKGRLKFGGSNNSAPFPSILAVWHKGNNEDKTYYDTIILPNE